MDAALLAKQCRYAVEILLEERVFALHKRAPLVRS
jgi:hypothetical protein